MKTWVMLVMSCFCLVLLTGQAAAFDSTKVLLLPLEDTAGYQSQEVNDLVAARLADHFRFPFYEKTVLPAGAMAGRNSNDKSSLAMMAKERQAGLVICVELQRARLSEREAGNGALDGGGDTILSSDVVLVIHAYQAKDDTYQSWSAERKVDEVLSANSGVRPAVEELVENLLSALPYKRIPN